MSLQQPQALPLRAAVLQITIRPELRLRLGQYPAMTLRGGLGYSLRNIACRCEGGKHTQNCLYAQLFEEQQGVMHDTLYIPYVRPFIIRTGENKQFIYEAADCYTFELLLFGEAIAYMETFIEAFRLFGQKGIGEERQRFKIEHVVENGVILYEAKQLLGMARGELPFAPSLSRTAKKLQLQLQTPLRLQVEGVYLRTAPIEALIDNLLRRIRSLLYFHHGGYFMTDDVIERWMADAFQCQLSKQQYEYVVYKRFSTRQKKQAPLDGIVGQLVIENVSPTLCALLQAGQVIHIGKQTAFGFGQYNVLYYQ